MNPPIMAPVKVDPTRVREFVDEESFSRWLAAHGATETELWIRIFKVGSGRASITPTQAIDACLCWGWIDAVRKGLDEESFLQRYCPRGKKSVWSQINVANVARLTAAGRMQPAGIAHVEAAKADGRWAQAYRVSQSEAPPDLLAAIHAEPLAAATYETLSSQNRFALTFRTLAMKTAAGRAKKVAAFVEMLKRGETPYPQAPARPAPPSRGAGTRRAKGGAP